MDNPTRRDAQMAYIADADVAEEMRKCRKILQKLNFMDRSDFEGVQEVVKELLGSSEGAVINPPFYCDYGSHIHVGKKLLCQLQLHHYRCGKGHYRGLLSDGAQCGHLHGRSSGLSGYEKLGL